MNSFVKSFVYPFLVALIIFSLIAFAVAGPVLNVIFSKDSDNALENGDGDGAGDGSLNSGLKSDATGMLTLLIIGTDEAEYTDADEGFGNGVIGDYDSLLDKFAAHPTRTVDFITLVSFDSTKSRTVITSIPNNAYVTLSDTLITMDTAYYYIENSLHDADYGFFADYISSVTGLRVDFYAYIDTDDYVSSFGEWGTIPITLDENVSFTRANGTQAVYSGGDQEITSAGLYDLIKYDGYSGAFTKANILEQAAKFALEKTATSGYFANFKAHFEENISKFYNTNATYAEFEEKIMLYFSYQFYTPTLLNVIGDLSDVGGKSRLTINRASTLKYFKL